MSKTMANTNTRTGNTNHSNDEIYTSNLDIESEGSADTGTSDDDTNVSPHTNTTSRTLDDTRDDNDLQNSFHHADTSTQFKRCLEKNQKLNEPKIRAKSAKDLVQSQENLIDMLHAMKTDLSKLDREASRIREDVVRSNQLFHIVVRMQKAHHLPLSNDGYNIQYAMPKVSYNVLRHRKNTDENLRYLNQLSTFNQSDRSSTRSSVSSTSSWTSRGDDFRDSYSRTETQRSFDRDVGLNRRSFNRHQSFDSFQRDENRRSMHQERRSMDNGNKEHARALKTDDTHSQTQGKCETPTQFRNRNDNRCTSNTTRYLADDSAASDGSSTNSKYCTSESEYRRRGLATANQRRKPSYIYTRVMVKSPSDTSDEEVEF